MKKSLLQLILATAMCIFGCALLVAIMSNRFYLALIYKKPMIVTACSVQAALVSEYGLGVVTSDCENLDKEIKEYLSSFNYQAFCERCNELLAAFVEEHRELECAIAGFMQT